MVEDVKVLDVSTFKTGRDGKGILFIQQVELLPALTLTSEDAILLGVTSDVLLGLFRDVTGFLQVFIVLTIGILIRTIDFSMLRVILYVSRL